jgi:hypothetical protein
MNAAVGSAAPSKPDPWLRRCPWCGFPVGRGTRRRAGKLGWHSPRDGVAPLPSGGCPGAELPWSEGLPHFPGEPFRTLEEPGEETSMNKLRSTTAHFSIALRALEETPRLARAWPNLFADIEQPTETLLRYVANELRGIATDARNASISAKPEEVVVRMSAATRADGIAVAFEWLSAALRASGTAKDSAVVGRLADRARQILDAAIAGA